MSRCVSEFVIWLNFWLSGLSSRNVRFLMRFAIDRKGLCVQSEFTIQDREYPLAVLSRPNYPDLGRLSTQASRGSQTSPNYEK